MPLLPETESNALMEFQKRLFRSRFLTISLLLHMVILLAFGGSALFSRYVEPPDFSAEAGEGFITPTDVPEAPQTQTSLQQQPTFTVTGPTTAPSAPTLAAIATSAPAPTTFTLPSISTPAIAPAITAPIQSAAPPSVQAFGVSMPRDIAAGIANFTSEWAKGGASGPGAPIRSRDFQFTAYLAKYSGDWDATVKTKSGKITGGSLPNLLDFVEKSSHGKIKTDPQPVPLDLASEEMFAKKPAFIFFCGHRDFKLNDKEIENLRRYIALGGCIWGDSSLPGRHSRFDIAFRREMRRVIPDVDKDFEPLPPTHEFFSRNSAKVYFTDITGLPPGMNFYQEPVYAMQIYGEIAVLYTANDYGDMWQIGLDERGQVDERRDEKNRYVALDEDIWKLRNLYFRNLSAPAILTTYKFGTNIVAHLLTRWEDKVRNVQRGL